MASLFSKALVYLGLVDEEGVDRETYPEQAPEPSTPRRAPVAEPLEPVAPARPSNVLPLGQVEGRRVEPSAAASRTTAARPEYGRSARAGGVQADILVVEEFSDARSLADRVRDRVPVVLDLRFCQPELTRRVVDFSSGLVYALDGTMTKVGEGLVLVSPPRVSLGDLEKDRLRSLGAYELDD
jgi:cell division inhibitor SepF